MELLNWRVTHLCGTGVKQMKILGQLVNDAETMSIHMEQALDPHLVTAKYISSD